MLNVIVPLRVNDDVTGSETQVSPGPRSVCGPATVRPGNGEKSAVDPRAGSRRHSAFL
jgi:hypothetical protein